MIASVGLIIIAAAVAIATWAVARGPDVADRAVATDVILYSLVGGVALIAIRADAPALADVVVAAALLGFLATVALAWYVLKAER